MWRWRATVSTMPTLSTVIFGMFASLGAGCQDLSVVQRSAAQLANACKPAEADMQRVNRIVRSVADKERPAFVQTHAPWVHALPTCAEQAAGIELLGDVPAAQRADMGSAMQTLTQMAPPATRAHGFAVVAAAPGGKRLGMATQLNRWLQAVSHAHERRAVVDACHAHISADTKEQARRAEQLLQLTTDVPIGPTTDWAQGLARFAPGDTFIALSLAASPAERSSLWANLLALQQTLPSYDDTFLHMLQKAPAPDRAEVVAALRTIAVTTPYRLANEDIRAVSEPAQWRSVFTAAQPLLPYAHPVEVSAILQALAAIDEGAVADATTTTPGERQDIANTAAALLSGQSNDIVALIAALRSMPAQHRREVVATLPLLWPDGAGAATLAQRLATLAPLDDDALRSSPWDFLARQLRELPSGYVDEAFQVVGLTPRAQQVDAATALLDVHRALRYETLRQLLADVPASRRGLIIIATQQLHAYWQHDTVSGVIQALTAVSPGSEQHVASQAEPMIAVCTQRDKAALPNLLIALAHITESERDDVAQTVSELTREPAQSCATTARMVVVLNSWTRRERQRALTLKREHHLDIAQVFGSDAPLLF